jgi:DNA processing protein
VQQPGSKLVQDCNDVRVELQPVDRRRLLSAAGTLLQNKVEDGPEQPSLPLGPMGEICRSVLGALKLDAPTQLEGLVESLDTCSSSEIIAALFELEMIGLIRQLPGKNFIKVWSEAPGQ